jgi:hypothetical protein
MTAREAGKCYLLRGVDGVVGSELLAHEWTRLCV